MVLNQQEQLAKDRAPVGGGYVCMVLKRGSNDWEFALSVKSSGSADQWWNNQRGRARVWQVKSDGQIFMRSAK